MYYVHISEGISNGCWLIMRKALITTRKEMETLLIIQFDFLRLTSIVKSSLFWKKIERYCNLLKRCFTSIEAARYRVDGNQQENVVDSYLFLYYDYGILPFQIRMLLTMNNQRFFKLYHFFRNRNGISPSFCLVLLLLSTT